MDPFQIQMMRFHVQRLQDVLTQAESRNEAFSLERTTQLWHMIRDCSCDIDHITSMFRELDQENWVYTTPRISLRVLAVLSLLPPYEKVRIMNNDTCVVLI